MYSNTTDTKQIALEIGQKLLDIDKVQKVCKTESNFIPYINAHPWDPSTLSHGYPSIILLFSALDTAFPNQGWDHATHLLITQLIHLIEKQGVFNSSLFSGLSGINFSILCASKNKTRYQALLKDLNHILVAKVKEEYLLAWHESRESKEFIPPRLWDVITGLSGVLCYLLHFTEDPVIYETCSNIIENLVWLSTFKQEFQGKSLPSFFTPSDLLLRLDKKNRYKPGCIDTGIAHGIGGILSVLSKAAEINGFHHLCEKGIREISSWLVDHVQKSLLNEKNIWPSRFVLFPEKNFSFESTDTSHRDGWCYGAPGIARALFLASNAIKDKNLRTFSMQIFQNVIERFPDRANLKCPSFCHGLIGFFTILYNMFLDTQNEDFLMASEKAIKIVIDRYDGTLPFGFKTLASHLGEDDLWIDNPGVLDGVVGIALGLLLFRSEKKQVWSDLFAI